MIELTTPQPVEMRDAELALVRIRKALANRFRHTDGPEDYVHTELIVRTIRTLASFVLSPAAEAVRDGERINPARTGLGRAVAVARLGSGPSEVGVLGISLGPNNLLTVESHSIGHGHTPRVCAATTFGLESDGRLQLQATLRRANATGRAELAHASEHNPHHLRTVLAEYCLRIAQIAAASPENSLFDSPTHLQRIAATGNAGDLFYTPVLTTALSERLASPPATPDLVQQGLVDVSEECA